MESSATPPANPPAAPAALELPPARRIPLFTWEQVARLVSVDPVFTFEPGTFPPLKRKGQL